MLIKTCFLYTKSHVRPTSITQECCSADVDHVKEKLGNDKI